MATRLSKNTFAKLFPAMQEDPEEQQQQRPDFSAFDPNEFADPVDQGGSGGVIQQPSPTRQSSSMFPLPDGAFTGVQTIGGHTAGSDITGVDPLAIETLVKIGQESKLGRADTARSLSLQQPYAEAAAMQPAGMAPAGRFGVPAERAPGTDTFGRAPVGILDEDPPDLPAGMRPARPKSALEAARERVTKLRDPNNAPVDRNKGIKSRVWEGVQNALAGMSMAYKANPNGHWAGILAGGAAGTVGGAINKTWNEQREREVEIARAEGDYESLKGKAEDTEKLEASTANRARQMYEAMTEREKLKFDALSKQQQVFVSQLNDLDEVDPDSKDPNVQEFIAQGRKLGIIVQKKAKGSKFSFDVVPNGDLIVGDTTTGQYKRGQGNYAKPATFTPAEIPDTMFGILADKEIDDKALAAVSKDFPTRRRIPQVEQQLLQMKDPDSGAFLYQNSDGTLNEALAVQHGITSADKLYENSPSDYEQRLAAQRNKLRASQAALKSEAANFRAAISNQNPSSDAPAKSITQVKDVFLKIMQLPAKERAAKLKDFYSRLSRIRITG